MIERGVPNSPLFTKDSLTKARLDVVELAGRLVEFYKVFDKWHCGLNQLKTFKKLSFALQVAGTEKIKQALEVRSSPRD